MKITKGTFEDGTIGWKAVNNGSHPNNPDITNWEIHLSDDGECVVDHVYEEADAHLISAAPDLLESCQELLNLLRFHGYHHASEINNAIQSIKKAKNQS